MVNIPVRKQVNRATFYVFDLHNRKYMRLAMVESMGLIYAVMETLKGFYPDNLYWKEGAGNMTLPSDTTLKLEKVK